MSTPPTSPTSPAPTTRRSAERWATTLLADAGIDSAAVEARELLRYALAHPQEGLPRDVVPLSELFFTAEEEVPEVYASWVRERARRTPMQHIVGSATFDGLTLFSAPGAFIPRPETELLVEWAESALRERSAERRFAAPLTGLEVGEWSVIDLCTGPGTILLALAARLSARPLGRDTLALYGVELNPTALALARKNEEALRSQGLIAPEISITWIEGDVRDRSLLAEHALVATADLVLTNPPYVPLSARGEVTPEVLADPEEAVFSGEDGLELMPAVVDMAAWAAAPRSAVIIEQDESTPAQVVELLRAAGFSDTRILRDLPGAERFVCAQMRRSPDHRPDPADLPPLPQLSSSP